MELFLDQKNYMLGRLSPKAGARLVIHDPHKPPLPDEYGVELAPGTASSIAIQKVLQFERSGLSTWKYQLLYNH